MLGGQVAYGRDDFLDARAGGNSWDGGYGGGYGGGGGGYDAVQMTVPHEWAAAPAEDVSQRVAALRSRDAASPVSSLQLLTEMGSAGYASPGARPSPLSAPALAGGSTGWSPMPSPVPRPGSARAGGAEPGSAEQLELLKQQLVVVRARKQAAALRVQLEELRSPRSSVGDGSPMDRTGSPRAMSGTGSPHSPGAMSDMSGSSTDSDMVSPRAMALPSKLSPRALHAEQARSHDMLAAQMGQLKAELKHERAVREDMVAKLSRERELEVGTLKAEMKALRARLSSAETEVAEAVRLGNQLAADNDRMMKQLHSKPTVGGGADGPPSPVAAAAAPKTATETPAAAAAAAAPAAKPKLKLKGRWGKVAKATHLDEVAAKETAEHKELRLRKEAKVLFNLIDADDSGVCTHAIPTIP